MSESEIVTGQQTKHKTNVPKLSIQKN